jgi:hypothetical protein
MAMKVHRSIQNLGLKLFNFMSTFWCPELGSNTYLHIFQICRYLENLWTPIFKHASCGPTAYV